MEKIREFFPAGMSYFHNTHRQSDGWVMLRTEQDSGCSGNWINPIELEFFSYTEGDTVWTKCASIKEFKTELKRIVQFYLKFEEKMPRIDSSKSEKIVKAWERLGICTIADVMDIID